jgi:1-acyl-sn-glycerol-3-phosphate acyltransferase
MRLLIRALVWLLTDVEVTGRQHLPPSQPMVVVSNHLGDADVVVGLAHSPFEAEIMAKAGLYDLPILGKLMDVYGVIWVHPGQPDRRALRTALQALQAGRMIAIAPEGRESLTGALEEGTQGAAYLALKAHAPLIPVTFTGTENRRIYTNMKRLRRTRVTLTVGPLFRLEETGNRQADLDNGARKIMLALARQLPREYRGIYQQAVEQHDGSGQPGTPQN